MKRETGKNEGATGGSSIPNNPVQPTEEFFETVDLDTAAGTGIGHGLGHILRMAQGPRIGVPFEQAKRAFDEQVAGREITLPAIKEALLGVEDVREKATLVKTLAMFIGSTMRSFAEELRALAQTDHERLMGAVALLYCDEALGAKACLSLYNKLSHSKVKYLPIQPHLVVNALTEYLDLNPSEHIQQLVENLREVESARRRYGA